MDYMNANSGAKIKHKPIDGIGQTEGKYQINEIIT